MENKDISFLVVDDQEFPAKSIGTVLDTCYPGCQITYGTNGQELIDLSYKIKPHLIITDNDMPIKKGSEAYLELRKSGILTPVIMITSKLPTELEEHVKNPDNKFSFLQKPAGVDELEAEVNKYLPSASN